MKKKLVAFDLDGTLAPSKSPLPDQMAKLLEQLISKFQVCIISGGKYQLFELQVLSNLQNVENNFLNLHIMPTSGTRYYKFDSKKQKWQMQYAEDFNAAQKYKIINALNEGFDESGWRPKKQWGELIEDRDSQITLSTLGQEAPLTSKERWDPSGEKKLKLRDYIAPKLPEYEVRAAGTTSIDVTKPGIDKAYGMNKLLNMLSLNKSNVLYVGDKLNEGGNDFPVKAMGIDCIEVSNWQDTTLVIETVLKVT